MPELLLELLSEEIPARMQGQAARDLERMARERLAAAGLEPTELRTYAGPRRLTLVSEGLPKAQGDRTEERKGPRVGAPEQAVEGFLRSTGLTRDQLVERDGVYFAVTDRKGRPTPEIVSEVVEDIVRNFPWPKSMTWGSGKLRWVRPLRRILCVFDRKIVPFAIDGIESGDLSEGHRFMGTGKPFRARDFNEYEEALGGHFVVLDPLERKTRILAAADKLCRARGLELVEDEGLLDEVAGLAEWPTPVLGDMDAGFLDLPAEVIRTSMRTHQKYFAVRKAGELGLAPHFITVANIDAPDDGKAIAAGNAKVLSARLSDARFFWDEDRKVPLEQRLESLKGVTFHAKLGTMYERVERIEALAREIAPLVGADPDLAAKTARLAKADLATGMVGEFPELQGLMGGYYARMEPYARRSELAALDPERNGYADGTEDPMVMIDAMVEVAHEETPGAWHAGLARDQVDEIADAVRDHYRPQGPNDDVPTAPLSVAVALADKLDTLVGFFAIDEKPTGSKDPYALRRAALGLIRIVLENRVRLRLNEQIENAYLISVFVADDQAKVSHIYWDPFVEGLKPPQFFERYASRLTDRPEGAIMDVNYELGVSLGDFVMERLKVLLRERGLRPDLIDAAGRPSGVGDDDLVRIVARVEALDGFLKTDDGANLLAGYKRAVNILKAEEKKGAVPSGEAKRLKGAPAEETALLDALESAEPKVAAALEAEDFTAAMTALAALRAPVDAFFEAVLVNADAPQERDNRLKLLGNVRDAMGRVADFSLIAG